MSNTIANSPRDAAVARYGDRFGVCPPLFYMASLNDDQFVSMIDAAVLGGSVIDTDQFEANLDSETLL